MAFEETSFTVDLIGRFVCNTWNEAINSGGSPFDVVVIGAGMHGGYCAEKIYRFGKEKGKNLRILVLDAGQLLLTQHEQNYPNINPNTGPFNVVTSNLNDPGPQEAVWGYPWRSNQSFPGIAFCIGGRSLYWGGWSPRLTTEDLNDWPSDVKAHLLPDYPLAEQDIGVPAALHEPLSAALIGRFTAAVAGTSMTVEPAPLAVQSTAPSGVLFSFDKYSSANLLIDAVREDATRDPTPANRQLLVVPHVNVTRILNDGTKATGIELQANGQGQTISTARELKPNFKVVIASSTIESTRLSLNSFPVNGMGANLMAHLRSNTTVTIPRSELGLGPPTQLETGMVLIRGSVPVTGGNHHFHLQVIAASNLASSPDSQVFTQIPDVDLLNDLIQAQSPDTIIMVLRAVGELSGDKTMTPPDGPKDPSKSWVDLTKDPNNLEFGTTRRAWVNLVTNADDDSVRLAMNQAAIDLAKKIAINPANVVVKSQVNDPLGSTHHEAGTLWMGSPGSSITDKDGLFHHISNVYVAGPALFPRIGSANPSLTAMALARNTAQVIVNSL
jgi:choline dehydrogenase-like flavoprotein